MTPTPPAPRHDPGVAPGGTRVGLVVCRGCCCGDPAKNPDIDHEAQLDGLERFANAEPAAVTVRTSECLGPCEYANIVVVRPSRDGRRRGARPVWLGLLDDYALTSLRGWVRDGGPGIVEIPDGLQLHEISRPRADTPRGAPAGTAVAT